MKDLKLENAQQSDHDNNVLQSWLIALKASNLYTVDCNKVAW